MLPPIPGDLWFTSAHAVATERWVLVSASACPRLPVDNGDTGYECLRVPSTRLFAFDRESEEWTSGEVEDDNGGVPFPSNIVGDVATVWTPDPLDEGRPDVGTVDLSRARLTREDVGPPPPTCSQSQHPAARLDAAEGAREVTFTRPGTDVVETAPIPEAAQPVRGSQGTICQTAGPFLLSRDAPTSAYAVYAPLDSAEPVYRSRGSVADFAAGEDLFAIAEVDLLGSGETELVVARADGTVIERRPIDGVTELRAFDEIIVLVTDDRGSIESIEVIG